MEMNKALTERVTAFNPQTPMALRPPKRGEPRHAMRPEDVAYPVEYLENGDVILRVKAPGAKTVTVESARLAVWKIDQELERGENDIFSCTLPKELGLKGNVVLNFRIDGAPTVIANIPVQHYGFQIVNFIEMPDPELPELLLKRIPHGAVTREIFWSETMGALECCLIYTPPGYECGEDYPVLYLQHGGGENETAWVYNGKLPNLLDTLIYEGKAVPFVVVMNDGMEKVPGSQGFESIEGILTEDCRRFVEKKYRVSREQSHRAIAGLSLGSMQASYIGMRHPELYSAIGSFTYLRCRDQDNTHEGNPHLNILKNYDEFTSLYRLLFRSIGGAEAHLHEFEEDDDFLRHYGIDGWSGYERHIYPGETHNWNCWRRAIKDFAQAVFQWI